MRPSLDMSDLVNVPRILTGSVSSGLLTTGRTGAVNISLLQVGPTEPVEEAAVP